VPDIERARSDGGAVVCEEMSPLVYTLDSPATS